LSHACPVETEEEEERHVIFLPAIFYADYKKDLKKEIA
jgi:hypothetical protein